MRLINLEKAIECAKEKDYIKTSEQEKAVREVFELAEVQAVPIEVLEELRAEIEQTPTVIWEENKKAYIFASYFKKQVLQIIDKYRKEQE